MLHINSSRDHACIIEMEWQLQDTSKINLVPVLKVFTTDRAGRDRRHTGTTETYMSTGNQDVVRHAFMTNNAIRNRGVVGLTRTDVPIDVRACNFNHTVFSQTVVLVDDKRLFLVPSVRQVTP